MATIPPGGTLTVGLSFGNGFISSGPSLGGDAWQPMNTAPRDGTTIEIRCTYGVAPWFGLYHWIETPFGACWAKVGHDSSGIGDEGPDFMWRPYAGDASQYADPTGGAQNTRAYWLRACGFNPRDYPGSELTFEQESATDRKETWGGTRKPSFLRRIADLMFGEGNRD